ncbi:MAG: hypothetical protein MZU97_14425 [Bacillus subtilis]|nr:hypothetical protein [Bacillus subtilis]
MEQTMLSIDNLTAYGGRTACARKGAMLFMQGDACVEIGYVSEGRLDIRSSTPDGPRMADPDRRGRLVLRGCSDVRRGEPASWQRHRFRRRRRHDDREERLHTPAVRRSPPVAPVPGGAWQEDLRHQAAGQAALASRSPLADPLLASLAARGCPVGSGRDSRDEGTAGGDAGGRASVALARTLAHAAGGDPQLLANKHHPAIENGGPHRVPPFFVRIIWSRYRVSCNAYEAVRGRDGNSVRRGIPRTAS